MYQEFKSRGEEMRNKQSLVFWQVVYSYYSLRLLLAKRLVILRQISTKSIGEIVEESANDQATSALLTRKH